jgi:integrative and conjugative element protein (TIGR02256 family)
VYAVSYYHIDENASSLIYGNCDTAFPNETGGILIGRFHGNSVLIRHAVSSGPMAKSSSVGFRRDGDYSQEMLDRVYRECQGESDYIGEWHSHPTVAGPSRRDRKAMRWIAHNKRYAMQFPVMGICMWDRGSGWILVIYQLDGHCLRRLKRLRASANGYQKTEA